MSSRNAKVTEGGKKGGKGGGKDGKEKSKGRGSRKEGKSKKMESDISGDDKIEEITEKETKVRAGADLTDIEAMKAIVSINTINLMAPPLPLKFGKWNSRLLDISKGMQLLASMKNQKFRMFKIESMIPLIMKRDDIEKDAIKMDISDGIGADAPELKLTEEGKKKVYLYAAGGHHRHWAIEKEVKDAKKEMVRLKDAIVDLEARGKGSEKYEGLIKEKEKEIEELERYVGIISKWGVIVYDEGE